jgi:predicted RNase H-like nuclease (RuvC/YqgF family)
MTEQYDDQIEKKNETKANDETLIRASSRLSRLEDEREAIAETLADLRGQVAALSRRLREGDTGKTTEDGKLLADIRYWLRAARETEAEIDEIRRRDTGIVGGYGLDLEQACVAVRCRLDSLRSCCGAEEIS